MFLFPKFDRTEEFLLKEILVLNYLLRFCVKKSTNSPQIQNCFLCRVLRRSELHSKDIVEGRLNFDFKF